MFISSPPCGDSRIFVAGNKEGEETTGDDNPDRHPDRQNRSQMRVKMETGQGTHNPFIYICSYICARVLKFLSVGLGTLEALFQPY